MRDLRSRMAARAGDATFSFGTGDGFSSAEPRAGIGISLFERRRSSRLLAHVTQLLRASSRRVHLDLVLDIARDLIDREARRLLARRILDEGLKKDRRM